MSLLAPSPFLRLLLTLLLRPLFHPFVVRKAPPRAVLRLRVCGPSRPQLLSAFQLLLRRRLLEPRIRREM